MLIGGIVLFVVAVGLIVFCTLKKRSTKPGLVVLPLAILMIGFPAIKGFEGFGFKFEIALNDAKAQAAALEANPDDAAAKKELESALNGLEANITTDTAPANVA